MGHLVVIRHAEAGDRKAWSGDDRLRPLTAEGFRQAEGLVELLAAVQLTEIRSSPYVRCRQTVEPLARARSLPILDDPDLAEGGSLEPLLDRAALTGEGCWAVCTHGDVLQDLLWRLPGSREMGDEERGDAKGGTWVVEVERSGVTAARYLPPPED
ncbi:MAG: histidine phosphatase family protein [Candidatus Dormibacteraeota bacterium]|nr:histidine phosphatase family protein [Candidatus Dormibacteraeota bacterium]MBO0745193.1 histidine phosphatase family protein [Candidatus Dormibacteraeota bacterium]